MSDPTRKFTDRATHYAAHRPSYAPEAIDELLRGLPGVEADEAGVLGTRGMPAADVGAGTGISSRLLAGRGCRVFAVEPNEAMRRAAEPHPGVEFVEGTAEATGLPDRDAVLVCCAQAFHWFDREPALTEFRRIATAPGRIGLVWNIRDPDDAFMQEYNALIVRHAVAPIASPWANDLDAADVLRRHIGEPRAASFENADRLSFDQSAGRALSASYAPNQGYAKETFIAELAALFEKHAGPDGRVTWAYRTETYVVDL